MVYLQLQQVVASYMKEECTLEATIQLPPEYPLRSVEVTCVKRMGVPEHRYGRSVGQVHSYKHGRGILPRVNILGNWFGTVVGQVL